MLLPTLERKTVARAEPAKIWKARSYIHDHLDEELSLTKIADFVGISSNHLSEKFKEVTGEKFVDYIARRRFQKACGLLQDRGLRISEIAFEVGFQSLSQFNRVFKKRAGQSPSQYRSTQHETRKSHASPKADVSKETLTVKMHSPSSPLSPRLRGRGAFNGNTLGPKTA